ncbi:MAG: hypothetical protein C0597_00460 [Marinilabiliales bacterium]|nr:MAG: hypothetical protein C0597_00460 [Marinilabiliales bacterium]
MMKNIVKYVIPLVLVIAIPFILFIQKKETPIQKYDRAVQRVFNDFNPTGLSVAIVKDGEIFFEKSHGYKNAEAVTFVDNNDIFNIASCTKAFTAAGIGKLIEEGKLNWDDKVIQYIPNLKLADNYITNNLTIKDILSHRTGFGTFYGDLLWYNTNYTNEEVIKRMQYIPIIYDFRTQFGYQNNMYMIAGEIIEKISGQSWEDFIFQNFLSPLEMTDTRMSIDQFDGTEEMAYPHFNDSLIGIYNFEATKAAASIWSSTRDLANWAIMLLNKGTYKNEQILNPETIRTLFSPQTILSVSEERESFGIHFRNYALGWSTYDYNNCKIVEHNGGMPGFISKVALIPEENMAVIILNNGFDTYGNTALFYSIVDIATDRFTNNWIEYYLSKKAESDQQQKKFNDERIATKDTSILPTISMNDFKGMYKDKMYGEAEIKLVDGKMHCTLLPAKKIFTSEMKHWNKDTYRVDFKDPFLPYGLVTFESDKFDLVTGFKIDLPSHDFHFKNLYFKKIH